METAKVDIRKLQLLNDRINQTIDALNQVRLTVHGLQHSSFQTQQAFGPFGQQGFGAQGYGPQGQPFAQQAFGQAPYAFGPMGGVGAQGAGNPWMNPITSWGMGLSHTSEPLESVYARPIPLAVDPYVASRVVQTFPFVQNPVTPQSIY